MSWQPMETAPKDGSVFLAFDKFGRIFSVKWDPIAINGLAGMYVKAHQQEQKRTKFVMWSPSPELPSHLIEFINFAKTYDC